MYLLWAAGMTAVYLTPLLHGLSLPETFA
jgi:hypothetical protein